VSTEGIKEGATMDRRIHEFTILLALACACASDDDDSMAADESSTGPDADALWDCVEPMVAEVRPLAGPGYDPAMGLVEPVQDTYVVATTKVWVPQEAQEEFLQLSGTVTQELDATPGMVAYALGVESTCGFFRTLSVYRSEAEMVSFVVSDAHALAMSRYGDLVVTGKTSSWQLAADAFPPTWAMADERLAAEPPL
jgi:hypothetical protein